MRALCVLLLVLIPVLAMADPAVVGGHVVDEAGAGVAGATVWVVATDQDGSRPAGHTATDETGAFSISDLDVGDPPDRVWLRVVAYREGLALGWCEVPDAPEDLLIHCLPSVTYSGRLVDAEGKGYAARVVPVTVLVRQGGLRGFSYAHIVGEMSEALAVQTDAEGRFSLSLCPPEAVLRLRAESDAFGSLSLSDREAETGASRDMGDVVILPPGSILLRVVSEADPRATRGLEVFATGGDREKDVYSSAEAATGDDGTASLQHLQPGMAQILIRFPRDARWQCGAATAEVKSGQTTDVEVTLQQAYEVTGRVVDAVSGEPIAGARMGISGREARYTEGPPPTGADGTYRAFVLPGQSYLSVTGAPDRYTQSDLNQRGASVTVTDRGVTVPDIALTPATRLEGVVVDAAGNPVPRALVYGASHFLGDALECDAHGRFHVMVPKVQSAVEAGSLTRTQQLWARSGDRMTREPLVLSPGREEPVRLVVEDDVACRVGLRAVDGDGRPVADAEASVMWSINYMATVAATGRTDGEGVYTSEPLWPFGSYSATAVKPGHRKVSSQQWEAAGAQTHDLGALALVKAAGAVAGRVVDAERGPVAGAKVTANGEGPGRLTTQTDAEGGFRLEGLYEGAVWVVARAGDTIGGARLLTGTMDGSITLLPLLPEVALGEPRLCTSCTDPETDRRVARELLEVLTASAGEEGIYTLLRRWARLDAERAFELAAGKGDRAQQAVLESLGQRLLSEDPQEAIACLESHGVQVARAYLLADAADRLRRSNPDLAAEVAQRAIIEAHGIADAAGQAVYLGRAAEALYDIDPRAAEPVLREAQSLAEKLGYDGHAGFARGCVAEALCRMDLDAALALLDGIVDDNEATRHQPNVAARIAPTQPETARELMAGGDDWQRGYKMPRVVYAMAPAHPDMALELARSVQDPAFRARTLGYAALALAGHDPARALLTLSEAVGVVAAAEPEQSGRGSMGPDATCAELAFIAAQMGYPASDGLCWMALSLRPVESNEVWGGDDGCGYLRGLALANPQMAVEVARDLYVQPGGLQGEPHARRLSDLAVAAAACDANLAAEMLGALDARVTEEKRRQYRSLWVNAIDCLLAEPQDRPVELLATYGNWVPGARGVD